MSKAELSDLSYWNRILFTLITFGLVSLMMACMVTTIVQLGELVFQGWDGRYLIAVGFLIALEAMYTRRALKNINFPDLEWILYRGTEWVIILIVLRIAYYLVHGVDKLWADTLLWQQDFGTYFFTGEYLFACLVALLVWGISGRFSSELKILEGDERILRLEEESGIIENRSAVRESLVNMILAIGGGMILATALMRVDAFANWFELPVLRAGVYNLLAYFLIALVLLSMTQFSLLRVGWILEHIPIRREIAGRWFLYSFGFILALAFISSLLPTSYSIGFLGVLNYLFSIIMAILSFIIVLLLSPILILFGLIARLFKYPEAPARRVEFPQIESLPAPVDSQVPWFELVKSLFFWVTLFAVVGFSIYYYLRQHQDFLENLRKLPLMVSLGRLWEWLRGWWGGVNRQIVAAVDAGLQRLRARQVHDSTQPWRFINLRRLAPRERVLFYYMAMVRRGGEKGFSRKPSQTPYEYSQALSGVFLLEGLDADNGSIKKDKEDVGLDRLVEIDSNASIGESKHMGVIEDINALTERFVEARYSRHEVTSEHASSVKRYWEHIKRALRKPLRTNKE